jgi:hypothetical protein
MASVDEEGRIRLVNCDLNLSSVCFDGWDILSLGSAQYS